MYEDLLYLLNDEKEFNIFMSQAGTVT